MEFRPEQICAACVRLPRDSQMAWIITRVVRGLRNGEYVVRDEDSEENNAEYTVSAEHLTHFPDVSGGYEPGEKILALWYDEESEVWSTMFYEATVVSVDGGKVIVDFNGSAPHVQTDETRLARLPQIPKEEESPPKQEVGRRVIFGRGPVYEQTPMIQRAKDDELPEQLRKMPQIKRLTSREGTPLLDMLEQPDLFPQDAPHVMVSGTLCCDPKQRARPLEACLQDSAVKVGRLSRMMHEWRK